MGGGKKSKSSPVSIGAPQIGENPYEKQLAGYASSMWDQTQAPRTYIGQDWEQFFNPAAGRQYDPSQLPAFSPLYNMARTGLEDQYSVAKENILSSLPRGGGMARQLGNLETGRAKDVGSLQSQISAPIISDLYNKAYNAGFVTGPTQAMGGAGGAAQTWNTRNLGQAQLDMQATQAALAMTAQSEAASKQSSGLKGAGFGSMLGKGLSSVIGSVVPGIGTAIGGMTGKGGGGGGGGQSSLYGVSNAYTPRMW